jgi:hypothetical protein
MRIRTRLCLMAAIASIATAASADEPKGYICDFRSGAAYTYDHGHFKAEPTAPLAFEIGAIDMSAQTAQLRTANGMGLLKTVQAVNALHFIEVVNEGYLNITTIYERDDPQSSFPAVHSRHFGLLGQPLVTQYQGFCEAH